MSIKEKRKKIEKLIISTFDLLDTSGLNTKVFKEETGSLTDEQFIKKYKDFCNSEENFYLIVSPYQKNEPNLENIEKALELNGLTTEEYVYFRDDKNEDGEYSRSSVKLPVFPIHIKRLEQIISKKNNFSFTVGQRNSLINQATGDDKVARNSDIESYALITQGANKTLQELLGPRADNGKSKLSMYRSISEKNMVRLDELEDDIASKATLRLMDVYLTSAGYMTDLMTPDLVLTQTLKDV